MMGELSSGRTHTRGEMTGEQGSRYDLLVRDCYRSGGYVYAPRLHDITGNRGTIRIARLASNENPDPPPLVPLKGARRRFAVPTVIPATR